MSSTTTNFKFTIKNNLPQMTVEDHSQANMLKLIFSKNFDNKNTSGRLELVNSE